MSMLNGRAYLLFVLAVVLGPLVGCVPFLAGAGDPESGGGGGSEVGSSEISVPGTNDPDAQSADQPEPSDEALPDFSVVDVNPDSTRHQEAVSPRDYLGQASAWYFGHST